MLNVLLTAEACNPTWASVPLVGANVCTALARRDDLRVTVATHVRNREGLAGNELASRAEIVFIDNEWVAKPMYRLGRLLRGGKSLGWTTAMAASYPAYAEFERQVAKRLDLNRFDLIHRVTPVSPTLPSRLPAKTDTPMLVGPLNGGLPWPREWPGLSGSEREWFTRFRGLYRRMPGQLTMWQHVAGVIAGSRHTRSEIPSWYAGRRFELPENGIDPGRFPIADGWPEPDGPFRFLSVGRLVPYKATDVTLDAMAAVGADCRLTVIGDGPQRKALLAQANRLGIADRVEFLGWVPQEELAGHMRRSQAFVFPSLREFGGGVVLEAMAGGLPSVIVDYGGPAELATDACAVRVPMAGREQLTASVADGMRRLVGSPQLCREMSDAGTRLVRERHTWDAKADTLVGMYRDLLGMSTVRESTRALARARG